MSDRVFLDSNVLVYCDDPRDPRKQVRALGVLAELSEVACAVISTQVLQEYFSAVTRKGRVPAEVARARVALFAQLEVVLIRPDLVLGAIDLHRLHDMSFWDALILRCASAAGCGRVLTEDMNHGQVIDGVRIENPFLAAAGGAQEGRATWQPAHHKRPERRRGAKMKQAGQ